MKMNILISANSRYVLPMISMLCSLFDTNPYEMDVYLMYNDISDDILDKLVKYCKQWGRKKLIPVYVDSSITEGLPVTFRLPAEIYFKVLSAELLPDDLHTVLFMDLDMIVTKSLKEIFETDLKDYCFAACFDIYAEVFEENKKNIKRLGLPENHRYINSGLIYYNMNEVRKEKFGRKLIEQSAVNKDILMYPEQDMINKYWADRCLEIPWWKYNCPPIMYIMDQNEVNKGIFRPLNRDEMDSISDNFLNYAAAIRDQASVIHYIGESKPWNKERPSAETYEIFDIPFNNVISKAAAIFEKVCNQ